MGERSGSGCCLVEALGDDSTAGEPQRLASPSFRRSSEKQYQRSCSSGQREIALEAPEGATPVDGDAEAVGPTGLSTAAMEFSMSR